MSKNFDQAFQELFERGYNSKSNVKLAKSVKDSVRLSEGLVKPVETIPNPQALLRPIFGKPATVAEPSIGGHPDFDHLKNSENTAQSSIVTLFMDMESSTRLGVIYPPETVFLIKNTFIRMAIDVIKAFDGHVHRIMGDAVMAFFGGQNTNENNVIDALNCSSVLIHIVQNSIIPKLEEMKLTHTEFGIRIGIDYGKHADVLWSSYGHYNISEVTATSFFVDVASKLQSAAGRNQVMIGQSLKEFLDFPEHLLAIKEKIVNGKAELQPYIKPNITDRDGNPINYRKFILKSDEYLKNTPFQAELSSNSYLPATANNFLVQIEICDQTTGEKECEILPASIYVEKNKKIWFKVRLSYKPQLPFKVTFKVENFGEEARAQNLKENGESDFGNHVTEKEITTYTPFNYISHDETSKYRGFQNMEIIVKKDNGTVLHRTKMGIYIR